MTKSGNHPAFCIIKMLKMLRKRRTLISFKHKGALCHEAKE
ncbi:MAG: hypothetical protein FD167_1948 [bacterium]|nr:MAG: hypothetical protein FD167_1948 [bacterium]